MKAIAAFLSIVLLSAFSFAQEEDYPVAMPTDQPGVVISPFAADRKLDVAGLEPGSLAMDPVAEKIFRVPYSDPAQRYYEDYLGNPVNSVPEPNDPVARPKPTQEQPVENASRQDARAEQAPAPQTRYTYDNPPPHTYPTPNLPPSPSVKPSWIPVNENLPPDLMDFLFDFNHLSSSNDPDALTPFYAERVDNYFGKRNLDRAEIYRDRVAYINRFPVREYVLDGPPVLLSSDGRNFEVMTRVNYAVSGAGRVRTGSVSDFIQVRLGRHGYEITGIEEAKAGAAPAAVQRQDQTRIEPEAPAQAPVGLYDRFEREQIERFLDAFSASGEINDPAACVEFMHPQIERYYSMKNPSRAALLKDRDYYIKRWPERRYWLMERPQITPLADGTWEAVSKIGYEVRNRSKYLNGVATSIVRLAHTPVGLRIVSVREK